MTRALYTRVTALESTWCPSCNITFAVPEEWLGIRRDTGESFWCPNGHSLAFKETAEQRLAKALEAERARVEFWRVEADREKRAASVAKGRATKLRKRAEAGVCPHCTRSFVQLARHVKAKHSETEVPK